MAENPLLPNRRLQELHALMLHCRDLDKQHRLFRSVAREAVLAATAVQLEQGDFFIGAESDNSMSALALRTSKSARKRSKKPTAVENAATSPVGLELPFAAGIAHTLQTTGAKNAVAVLTSTSAPVEGWRETLTFAQQARLPLILICLDLAVKKTVTAKQDTLSLQLVGELSKRNYLPVLTVDGDDAVAMYRVMQESLLRARMKDGPSVVWCSLEPQAARSAKSKPVTHMEQYLASRSLKPLR